MLIGWLRKLLDFHREIETLRLKVVELSWDEPFGMLTRNAFLQLCRELSPKPRRVVFIDLDDIGDLDLRFGYTEVDRRIKTIFSGCHKTKETVARWYSGDEIVILFDDLSDPVQRVRELQEVAQAVGITFNFASGVGHIREASVGVIVNSLSRQVCRQKTVKKGLFLGEAIYETKEFTF